MSIQDIAETLLSRLRAVLYELALGLGQSLAEDEEKEHFLAAVAERLMPLACALAESAPEGGWRILSHPRQHDWARLWPELLAAGPGDLAGLPAQACWSVSLPQGSSAHLWPLGDFGIFAMQVASPYPVPALHEIARLLERLKWSLAACRHHAWVTELLLAQRVSSRVFGYMPQAMVFCDADTRIVDVNPAFTRITGYTREEALGQTPKLLASGRHDRAFFDAMWQAIRDRGHWQGEIWNRRKDGSIYPEILTIVAVPDETGKIDRYVGLFQDIGEQKARQAELEALHGQLERNNAYLQSILDNLGEGVYTLDDQGRCTFFNAAAERLLGWRAEEVLNKDLHEIIHHHRADGSFLSAEECPIRLAFLEERSYRSEEETFWHKDGTPVPVRVVAAPLYEGERLMASVAVFDDVSAQKELTRRLKEAKEAAEAAARMKSNFLAVMSHEIRTPLNGVIGIADLLADTPLDAEQADYARTIKASADHLLSLINDILDYSKLEAGAVALENVSVALGALLDACLDVVAPRLGDKPVLLSSHVDPGLPPVIRGDATRLKQILLNLLGNAVKFTAEGKVTLAAEALGEDRIRFLVEDTGPGIAPEVLPRLFTPFTQAEAATTRKYGGTGLGLAIARKLAEAMGGTAGVASEVGVGSRFFVDLPLVAAEARMAHDSLAGLTLALIGEESPLLALWQRLLASWRMKTRLCPNEAAMAEALAAGAAGLLAVAPQEGASDVLAALTQKARVPLIVALPQASPKDARERWLAAGAAAVFVPPFAQSRIHDRLAELFLAAPTKDKTAPAPAGAGERRGGLNLLLAEDNPVNQRVAVAMLQKLGHTTKIAANGREAVAAWEAGNFDLVLMDCQMPEMDGFAATAEIRRREAAMGRPRTRIVAMTANALEGDREKCLAAGMDDYLSKPVTRERLEAVLFAHRPTEASAAMAEEVFDPRQLEVATGGDSELAREILAIFAEGLPGLLEKIHAAAQARDTVALRAAAHELKGSAANVGAAALSRLAAEIETAAKTERIAHAQQALEQLAAAARDFAAASKQT